MLAGNSTIAYTYVIEIVQRVRNKENPPFRPIMPASEDVKVEMIALVKDCWAEEPTMRHSAAHVKTRLQSINRGKLVQLSHIAINLPDYAIHMR